MAGSRIPPLLRLLRWLGPWTDSTKSPTDVERTESRVREGELRGKRGHDAALREGVAHAPLLEADATSRLDVAVYEGRRTLGLIVIGPGLHFDGPDDPRMDRFCRVLAHAGFVVVVPYLPSYVDLRVDPKAVEDHEQVTRWAMARFPTLGPPTLFSISFGSWPSLEVAARLGDAIDSVITFGGYANFSRVARFNLDGGVVVEGKDERMPFDVTNAPAVFVNILEYLRPGEDTRALAGALQRTTYATWGRPEMKDVNAIAGVVSSIEPSVPEAHRELYAIGAGVRSGGVALLERALVVGATPLARLSPLSAIGNLRCPVVVCHGRDDDVIPWTESHELASAARAVTPTLHLVTGLFAHTAQERPKLSAVGEEIATLMRMVRCIASAGALRGSGLVKAG